MTLSEWNTWVFLGAYTKYILIYIDELYQASEGDDRDNEDLQ
jgi:hypothetical protein